MGLPSQFIRWIYLCVSTASFSVAVNGELAGFFPSARGIPQGCSLLPYLYVIVSNVLSNMLNQAAADGKFGYHSRCKEVQLTHLSFADDILVFTDGTAVSLNGVLTVMDQFAGLSGLHINASKSFIFTAGANSHHLIQAALEKGLTVATLPIRYLGMPLTTRVWSKTDYEPLIDKLRKKFLSWTHKALSFAGCLQLIKTTITSTVNFWSSAFILPKGCLDTIESMCAAFLWSGSPSVTYRAKVSWDDVCFPKEEGGLGLRKLRDTSRVFALRLIWLLFTQTGSFWVAWTNKYLLKDGTYWDAKDGTAGSWAWRKLLKLHPLAYEYLKYEVSDGKSVSFWFDDWLGMGKLIEATGDIGTQYLGVARHASIADAADENGWKIRSRGNRRFPDIYEKIYAVPLPNNLAGPDKVLWRKNDTEFREGFYSASTWNHLRSKKDRVVWRGLLWFGQAVPRHSFMVWLAFWNRLSTGDRMRAWGIIQDCTFCGEVNETRDHLFSCVPTRLLSGLT